MIETHIFDRVIGPLLLKALADEIRKERLADPTSALGVGTGWSGGFQDHPKSPYIQHFHNTIQFLTTFIVKGSKETDWQIAIFPRSHFRTYEIATWSNIMEQGDKISIHDHLVSHLGGSNKIAGVLFVEAPDPTSPLCIENDDPIKAVPGRLVVFDASTRHWVLPVTAEGSPRISIGFNARLVP